jgi:hypothetical protein
MKTIYVPGRDAADVALESWDRFAKHLNSDGYSFSLLQTGETEGNRRTRLVAKLYSMINDAIIHEWRKSRQAKVSSQINVDFNNDWSSELAEASLLSQENNDAHLDLLEELESLRNWTASQTKAPWQIVQAIITIGIESEATGNQYITIEELRAEVNRILGKYISTDKVRYARLLLEEKAETTPALRRFFSRKL